MMTRLEQEVLGEARYYMPEIAKSLSAIAKSLSAIATELHELNGHHPDISQSAMGPGDNDDLPF